MLRHIFTDGGYAGPALRDALKVIGRWTVQVIKRSDTSIVLPRRWVVEHTFAWPGRCRRLSKDWEQSIASCLCVLRSVKVVDARHFVQSCLARQIAFAPDEFPDSLPVKALRLLSFGIAPRRATFDASVTDAQNRDGPVKLRPESMAIVGPDVPDAEWEHFDSMVDESYRIACMCFS